MKTKMKLIFPAVLGVLLFAFPSVQAATASVSTNKTSVSTGTNSNPEAAMTALFGDPVIAKGKGLEFKRSELERELTRVKVTLAARGRTPSLDDLATLKVLVLNNLIANRLLLAKATEVDKAKGREDFEKIVQQSKANAKLTGEQFDQRLDQQLKLMGLTREQWEKESIEQITIPAVLERELKVNVTDAEATNFYAEHHADFEQPETVHLCDILLLKIDPATRQPLTADQQQAKRKQIDDLLKRIRGGESFTNLASKIFRGSKLK